MRKTRGAGCFWVFCAVRLKDSEVPREVKWPELGPYWGTYGIVYRVLQPLLVKGDFLYSTAPGVLEVFETFIRFSCHELGFDTALGTAFPPLRCEVEEQIEFVPFSFEEDGLSCELLSTRWAMPHPEVQ